MEFKNKALDQFKRSLEDQNDWVGNNAKNWSEYFLSGVDPKLDKRFNRSDLLNSVLKSNLTNNELSIAILSWGGMNREHGKSLFKDRKWLNVVAEMRTSSVSRAEAYEKFKRLRKNKKLVGMGPAYFTKLICFTNSNLNGYIMDQWTSKSINILLDQKLIYLTKQGSVSDKNTSEIYNQFCEVVEQLSLEVGKSPIDTEEALFSYGGFRKGLWRKYVIRNWYGSAKSNSIKKQPNQKWKGAMDYTDMESLDYQKALNFLSMQWKEIPTLGLRSTFHAKIDGDHLIIKNSKSNEFEVDEKHWNKVMKRIDELPPEERLKTSRYGQGKHDYNWDDCPNRVFSIYIPAIVRHIINTETV